MRFLVLASDGLWDAMSSEDVVKFVAADNGPRDTVAARLVEHALLLEVRSRNSACTTAMVSRDMVRAQAVTASMTLEQLYNVPRGAERRSLHDDMTVVVVHFAPTA